PSLAGSHYWPECSYYELLVFCCRRFICIGVIGGHLHIGRSPTCASYDADLGQTQGEASKPPIEVIAPSRFNRREWPTILCGAIPTEHMPVAPRQGRDEPGWNLRWSEITFACRHRQAVVTSWRAGEDI